MYNVFTMVYQANITITCTSYTEYYGKFNFGQLDAKLKSLPNVWLVIQYFILPIDPSVET